MPQKGVELIVNPGCDLESSRTAVALAEEFPHVYAAVGVHPSDCGEWGRGPCWSCGSWPPAPRCGPSERLAWITTGRTTRPGLSSRTCSTANWSWHSPSACPLSSTTGEAHQDCLSIVREHPQVTGVYHCYSGSLEDAKVLVKLGWMLSFTGVITYKNARKALEVIDWLPMDRIMIETDSPYLTPEPFRGKAERLRLCPSGGETIAQVKGVPRRRSLR